MEREKRQSEGGKKRRGGEEIRVNRFLERGRIGK